ncbi:uncharacterized protein LOC116171773 isoform X1 [Photinus pyralis]|uniref:uncharacterized protein LOC116171773 isoform X1 n=1 Tax=Photinus pyralis TaxID=7054 RepID=UPI001267473F|nr:uncharacterized protein LOC116171773 isoform X1 [Photinus pyralis]
MWSIEKDTYIWKFCLESCYWHLIEKRFCYDESIALYEEPAKPIEKSTNAFDNIAFYDQVALIAGRSIVTIEPLPKKPKAITQQPKPRVRWWETEREEGENNNNAPQVQVKVLEIDDQPPKEKPAVNRLDPMLLNLGEVKLRPKSLAERRNSRSLTLNIDRRHEIPIIRQASMPKFFIDTPEVHTDPVAFREPSAVFISPLSVNHLSDPFDLKSVVQLEKDNRNVPAAPIHRQQSAYFSRLSLIKDKLKAGKLTRQGSASNLPHSIQHI